MQRNVLDYLERSAKEFPDKIVFADEENEISYQDFVEKAKQMATKLSGCLNGVLRQPIMVLADRSIESILAFFAVVYSGNFYVPVDKDLPVRRIEGMLYLLSPAAVLYCQQAGECAGFIHTQAAVLPVLGLEHGNMDEGLLQKIRRQGLDSDPLYAIFTSGSTGVPKGVLVAHHSVIDLVDNFKEEFAFDDTCIFGNQAPFDFDVSVKDIYSTIKNGATMYVIPKKYFMMPVRLMEYLNDRKINTIIWAVSALVIVANFKTFSRITPQYLKRVLFSGEVMPNKILNYWRANVPEAAYVNLYGPTEITCNCTFYKVEHAFEDTQPLPIGKSFKNTKILLMDRERKGHVGGGETGEICVGGSTLALGYYNNEEKTKEAFIQNPLNGCYPERIYCTGDLGKYDENGDLVFLSRRDFQIKHMGHRIELGEIEVAVNAIPFIEAGVCLYDEEKEKIVLFYQAGADYKKEIVAELGKTLPKYMWPNVFKQYEKLPLNKNAKIDRVKLREEL